MSSTAEKVCEGLMYSAVYILAIAGIGLLLAFPIKWTWNATMPYLFALPTLTWGKAWCLNFLFTCFLKSAPAPSNK